MSKPNSFPVIARRASPRETFDNYVQLRVGMCITARINEDREIITKGNGHALSYPNFVYVVGKIDGDRIVLIDTAHNNTWKINQEELAECEVVDEFHPNCNDIDCEFINRVLTGYYEAA
jgi:hypothetical protein